MISRTRGTGARRISIALELPVAFDLIAGAVSAPYAGPLFVRRQPTPHSITRNKSLFAIHWPPRGPCRRAAPAALAQFGQP